MSRFDPQYKSLWLVLTLLFLSKLNAHAQLTGDNYPVQAHVYVNGAGTRKVAELFSSSTKLSVDLILKDLTKTTLPVYLEWQIEGIGLGVQIGSTPGFVPGQNITLQKGRINTLKGIDLREYFQPGVVDVAGVPESVVFNGSLPEGFYVIRVRAYEAGTGRIVSNRAETFFSIAYALPPIINLPFAGSEVPVTRPQNVLLQWTPRHTRTPGSSVLYNVTVCPVAEDEEPYAAMNSRGDCFQLPPQTSTTYNLSAADLPLQMGQRYAVQVQAEDLNQGLEFQNEGYSETTWFRYGKQCTAPERLTVNEIGPGRVNVSWQANEQALGYKLEYKTESETDWTALTTLGTGSNVYDLRPDETYHFRVATTCAVGYDSPFSDEATYEVYGIGPEDEELDDLIYDVLHPLKKRVSVIDDEAGDDGGTLTDPTSGKPVDNLITTVVTDPTPPLPTKLADLLDDPTKIPCAGQISTYENCDVAGPTDVPTGTIPLTSLSVGDYLTVADYAVVITEVGVSAPLSGKGLARLPFMNDVFVGVEFSGVSAIKDETKPGGCVSNVPPNGFFRVRNMAQAELEAEEQTLINTIRENIDPESTLKTLDELITDYTETGTEIKTKVANGDPVTEDEKEQLIKENTDLITGLTGWQDDINELTDGLEGTEINQIRADIQALLNELEENKATITTGGGYPVKEDVREEVTRITTAIKQLLENQEPAPPQITNVIAKNITDNSATISWEGDPRFTRYVVTYQKTGEGEVTRIVTNPEVELTGLGALSTYNLKIKGYVADNEVSSATKTITTINNAFQPPKNLAYQKLSENSVKLTWNKDAKHIKYKLRYTDQLGNTRFAYPTTNEITLTGLNPDTRYPFELIAFGEVNLTASSTGEFATELSCDLSVSVSKGKHEVNGAYILITATCIGTITWNAPNDAISVPQSPNPDGRNVVALLHYYSSKTAYLAICTVNDGSDSKVCSKAIEVEPAPATCDNFYIEASEETDIVAGQYVFLTPKGCNGVVSWIGYGREDDVDIAGASGILDIPIHETTKIEAVCTFSDGATCSASKTLDVQCKAYLSAYRDGREVVADGQCTQGFLTIAYASERGGLGIGVHPFTGNFIFDNFNAPIGNFTQKSGKDYRFIAACYDAPRDEGGNLLCYSAELEVNKTQGFFNLCRTQIKALGYEDEFCDVLKLEATDCGNNNKPVWYENDVELVNFRGQENIVVYPESPTLYKVECGKCTATKLIEPYKTPNGGDFTVNFSKSSSTEIQSLKKSGNGTSLDNITDSNFPLRFSAYQCIGEAAVYTIPAVEFTKRESFEGCADNSSFTINTPFLEETKLIFTCTAPNGRVDRIERTYIPKTNACLQFVDVPSEINLGEEVTLSVDYCDGVVEWFRFPEQTPFAEGLSVTDAPCTNTIYVAKCTGIPTCSEPLFLKVNPCKIEIIASIGEEKAKVGECITLEVNGCDAGKVVWEDGSTGTSRDITPFKDKTYAATCTVYKGVECDENISIQIEEETPSEVDCPDFSLEASKTNLIRCFDTEVTVKPFGCPAGSKIRWSTGELKGYNEAIIVNPNEFTQVEATCISPYNNVYDVQSNIEFQLNEPEITLSTDKVIMGYTSTIYANGCYNEECNVKDFEFSWEDIYGFHTSSGSSFSINTQFGGATVTERCGSKSKVFEIVNASEPTECTGGLFIYDQKYYRPSPTKDRCDYNYSNYWFLNDKFIQKNTKWFVNSQLKKDDSITMYCIEEGTNNVIVYCGFADTTIPSGNTETYESNSCSDYKLNNSIHTLDVYVRKGEKLASSNYPFFYLENDWCYDKNNNIGSVSWTNNTGLNISLSNSSVQSVPYQLKRKRTTFNATCKIPEEGETSEKTCFVTTSVRVNVIELEGGAETGSGIVNLSSARVSETCEGLTALPAQTLLSVYLSSILCQNEGLFKDCDGVYSRELADTYINNLKTALQNNSAFNGITLDFPANNDAIIAALQSGDCEAAGGEMATDITGEIDVEKYNKDIRDAYDDIVDSLLPEELELSTTTEQPSCSLPNGEITVSVSNGVAPYQYSIDNGTNWSDETTETTYTFTDLAAGQYTITVRDSEGNEGRIGVELETTKQIVFLEAPIGITATSRNLRIGNTSANQIIKVRYSTQFKEYEFVLKAGIEATWDGYKLDITKVPESVSSEILGIYTAGFNKEDPNEFAGFYNINYNRTLGCTNSAWQYTDAANKCNSLCVEGFLSDDAFIELKGRLNKSLTEASSPLFTPNLDQDLIGEIDLLLNEMVSDGSYESFIKSGLITYKNEKGLINNTNLRALKQLLLDYREVQNRTFGKVSLA